MFDIKKVEIIGTDLDGTLYKSTPEMDDRVRTQIAHQILKVRPSLESLERARELFEERYKCLHSGTIVLQEFYPGEASQIMDECNACADVTDLIKSDPTLARILKRTSERTPLYLLTSSPEELAYRKLDALGINPAVFLLRIFNDTPHVGIKPGGKAFDYVIDYFKDLLGISASGHVYIGDKEKSDILPARKLNMQTIAVWSDIPKADLSINHIHQLEELFLNE